MKIEYSEDTVCMTQKRCLWLVSLFKSLLYGFFVNSNAMKCQWRPWRFKILLKEERYRKSIILFCFVLYCVITLFKYLVLKCHNKVYSQREFVDVDLKFSLISKFQNNKTKNCVVLCLKFFGNGAMYLPLLNFIVRYTYRLKCCVKFHENIL